MNHDQYARLGQQVAMLVDEASEAASDAIIASEVRALVELYREMYE